VRFDRPTAELDESAKQPSEAGVADEARTAIVVGEATPSSRSWRRLWWVAPIVVALALAGTLKIVSQPEKFDYGAYIYIWGDFGSDWSVSGQFNACEGAGRFSDLRLDAPVVIEDARGNALATAVISEVGVTDSAGRMGSAGSLDPLDPRAAGCHFYTHGDVPELDSYQLRAGSLPPMVVKRGEGLVFDWRLDDEPYYPDTSEFDGQSDNPLAKMFVREDRSEFED
jgi:hypothetical protein